MGSRQHFLLLVAAGAAALVHAAAGAQVLGSTLYNSELKQGWWGRSALGLAVNRSDFRLPCQSLTASCEEVSLVGRASIGDTPLNLTGKIGSTYPRGYGAGTDNGSAVSYGAGVTWDFSSRASASLTWDLYDLRGVNAPVRSTSLGLQWRY